MTSSGATRTPATAWPGLELPSAVAFAAAAGLVLGGLTQLGQSHLPDEVSSLANSAAPWMLIALGCALLSRTAMSACLSGTVALAALEIGYVITAAARGFPSATTTVAFWLTAAAVFGPMAGLAAYSLRARAAPWAALGGGLIAGVVSGEGLASFVTVRDTTSPGYWIAQMVVGTVLLVLVARRTRSWWVAPAFVTGVAALWATRFVPVFGG